MKKLNLVLNKRLLALAIAVPAVLTGCASALNPAGESTFSCPGMPQGIICKTPMAVYKSTEQMPAETEYDMPIGKHLDDKEGGASMSYALPKATPANHSAGAASRNVSMTGTAIVKSSKSKPIREPAQVMRIWIAEWTDKNDDLHYPGYLFTEIQPRRWSVGKPESAGRNSITPFRAPAAPVAARDSKEQPVAAKPSEGEARQSAAISVPGLPSPSDINLN
ncbi:type IV conjugative transfer system lipoprotein TraV [Noviherbaspirillum pedocola]|uniref:type IV conjugative transfer system lipoprotein TraV n=1 Tax=Noviherbaspirillum pedocola TaxID=2801341 RepID=UPI001F2A4857|nr:type IV conjugative transfer system lipoprotein TraV [Noviherbaspirillum pedocola]